MSLSSENLDPHTIEVVELKWIQKGTQVNYVVVYQTLPEFDKNKLVEGSQLDAFCP